MAQAADNAGWTVAWVTGASGGIGRELVKLLSERGVRIAATARSKDRLAELAAAHAGVTAFPADVTDPQGLKDAVAAIEAELGAVDLALLGAGVYAPFDVRAIDLEGGRRTTAVNIDGVMNALAAVLPRMIERGRGHVVIMGSLFGYSGWPGNGAYGASKAALINLAESLRLELRPLGIDVTIVNPGFVDTGLNAAYDRPKPYLMRPDKAARRIMDKLPNRPFEIAFPARVVGFLKIVRVLPRRLAFALVRHMAGRQGR